MQFSDLFNWKGKTGRQWYALAGLILFFIKYNLDRVVAERKFHHNWSFSTYFLPFGGLTPTQIMEQQAFFTSLFLVALPFIWTGVVLSLRRLHDAALPPWLVLLFFIPVVNLFFFSIMAVVPSRDAGAGESRLGTTLGQYIPYTPWASAAVAVLITGLPALALAVTGTDVLRQYGYGLFLGLPFAVGLVSVLIYGYHERRTYGQCMLVSLMSITLVGAGLFIVAAEGAVCILMAAPIAAILALMGGSIGYAIEHAYWSRTNSHLVILATCIMAPLLMGAEYVSPLEPPLMQVTSAVTIDAPPEVVWQHVVSFDPLPPPDELIFQTGIAYPERAIIRGTGVGAVRYCQFSTGAFIEPIEVWDEPHLLRFGVRSQPQPMAEWSFYHDLQAAHLDNYLVSERGQFVLVPQPDGRTRLEGTTWYRHRIWPVTYWRVFSDRIIHTIHMRVLRHIQHESEAAKSTNNRDTS